MPSRIVVAKELAEIFKIIAHPDRIRLIEAAQAGDKDVNTLAEALKFACISNVATPKFNASTSDR